MASTLNEGGRYDIGKGSLALEHKGKYTHTNA